MQKETHRKQKFLPLLTHMQQTVNANASCHLGRAGMIVNAAQRHWINLFLWKGRNFFFLILFEGFRGVFKVHKEPHKSRRHLFPLLLFWKSACIHNQS